MALLEGNVVRLGLCVLLLMCTTTFVSSHNYRHYKPPSVTQLTGRFSPVLIDNVFNKSFGGSNINFLNNGSTATLSLNKTSGSGLASKASYYYGFFSAAIKLPSGLSPGVVVAFYLSNAETYPHNHDEMDIELLGHDKKNDWAFQTNVYANGSVSVGREEKFYLWFDPTEEYHYYSIIWNKNHIVFLVDNIPVREFVHDSAFPSIYPSKAMALHATIWDGSRWATHGGKYPVNYKYAPFVVSFAEMEVSGCVTSSSSSTNASAPQCNKSEDNVPSGFDPIEGSYFVKLSPEQFAAMDWARRKVMFYSYCDDKDRFKVMPPECG